LLITSKVLDARRRGATAEPYGAIGRKHAPAQAGGGAIDGNAAEDALKVIRGVDSLFPPYTIYVILIIFDL